MSILVGDFGDDDLDVATTLPAPSKLGTLAVPAALLETRYDVLASRAALDVELANFDGLRKDNWPALRLSGRVGSSGAELSDLFDPDFYVASLTASISAILFDSGRNAARVDLAEARIDAAMAAYAQAVRDAKRHAEHLVETLDVKLGRVFHVTQMSGYGYRDMYSANSMMQDGEMSSSFETGLIKISAELGVVYLIDYGS